MHSSTKPSLVLLCLAALTGCGPSYLAFIGNKCLNGADCADGMCFDEARTGTPGGWCSALCHSDEECGGSAACLPTASAFHICVPRCSDPGTRSSCRNGYQCVPISGGRGGVCTPGEPPQGANTNPPPSSQAGHCEGDAAACAALGQYTCANQAGCGWSGTSCVEYRHLCASFTSGATCGSRLGCQWVN